MTEVCILKPKIERGFDLQKTSDTSVVKTLTLRQIDTLMEGVRKNQRPSSLKISATVEKEPIPFCQQKIAQMHVVTKDEPLLFTPQLTVPTLPTPKKSELGFERLAIAFYTEGLRQDASDDSAVKSEVDHTHKEATKLHQEKMEKLKKKIDSEAQASSWGVAVSVFSWMGSLMGIITGIAMIATGVGAVAGAMILIGGICTLGSQILEVTGGWDRITRMLPDDSPERKAAVRTWIQLAIAILGVVLGLSGGVLGGFGAISESMSFANAFMGGFVLMAMGVTRVGKGFADKKVSDNHADVKGSEIKLARNDMKHEDLVDRVEDKYSRQQSLSHFLRTIFYLLRETNSVLRKSV